MIIEQVPLKREPPKRRPLSLICRKYSAYLYPQVLTSRDLTPPNAYLCGNTVWWGGLRFFERNE
jgi:hypothetical protein